METKTKVHITRCKIEGPKLDKNNKQYWKVGIQTRENGEQWFNSNYFPFNPDRWEGTDQEVILYDEEYQGKTYKKFKLPPREFKGGAADPRVYTELVAIRTEITMLRQLLEAKNLLPKDNYPESNGPTAFDGDNNDIPEDEIDPRDIIPA